MHALPHWVWQAGRQAGPCYAGHQGYELWPARVDPGAATPMPPPPCHPPRRRLAAPAHLAAILLMAPHNQHVCSGAALAHPAAQELTGGLLGALEWLRGVLAPPAAHAATPRGHAQCGHLLLYLQLSLGFAIPATWHAFSEAALFEAHQKERAAVGLPPERGWQAALYAGVERLRPQGGWGPQPYLLSAWALAGMLWNVSVLLAPDAPPRGAA